VLPSYTFHHGFSITNDADVIIIGAGCIGASIARELSKFQLSVLVLESADDVTQGATKGNSGIVHAGFDDTPGTNRAKFCWPGNQMFADLDRDLHFGYQRNGSLVLATNEDECHHLQELLERGLKNGVQRLRIIDQAELRALEPAVNTNAVAALLAPDAGNLIPYEYTIAMMENAVDNGVEVRIRRQVTAITPSSVKEKGSGSFFKVVCKYWEPSSYVKACGGVKAVKDRSVKSTGGNFMTTKFIYTTLALFVLSGAGTSYGVFPWILNQVDISRFKSLLGPLGYLLDYDVAILSSLTAILMVVYLTLSDSEIKRRSSAVIVKSPPVGSGGGVVSVESMMLGGSGSCDVMDGQVVDEEVHHARFVVNCAGSYSDKIAGVCAVVYLLTIL